MTARDGRGGQTTFVSCHQLALLSPVLLMSTLRNSACISWTEVCTCAIDTGPYDPHRGGPSVADLFN